MDEPDVMPDVNALLTVTTLPNEYDEISRVSESILIYFPVHAPLIAGAVEPSVNDSVQTVPHALTTPELIARESDLTSTCSSPMFAPYI
jgi:hypothetical protein